MPDNIISFKTAKKRAGYAQKAAKASENRVKFSRTKAEKRKAEFEKMQAKTKLDDRKLDDE